jgi:hypothetical protein
MKKLNYLYPLIIIVSILLALNLTSCTQTDFTPDFVDKPVGNEIDLTLKDKTEYSDFELLFINEDTLYTLGSDSKIFRIHIKNIEQICVNGYSDRSWMLGVAGLQIAPAIALGIAANSVNKENSGFLLSLLLLVPAAVEIAMFESSTPKAPVYKAPFENRISEIKKYARYPIEMTREQISVIEKFYGLINIRKENKK